MWQSLDATDRIRSRYRGQRRNTALGIYQSMTEAGNEARSASFEMSRAELAELAGVSDRALDTYAPAFVELGILVVERRQDAQGRDLRHRWVLLEPRAGGSDRGEGASPPSFSKKGEDYSSNELPSSPSRRRKSEQPRADVDRLCETLARLVAENGRPGHLIGWPSDAWRRECRLLLDRDRRHPAEAEELIRWCQADAFWRSNILGMPKFREQYDRLRLRASSNDGLRALLVDHTDETLREAYAPPTSSNGACAAVDA